MFFFCIMKLIGFCGLAGAGKDTCGDFLIKHGFKRISFATALKDIVAVLFGWNREMLEGRTTNHRWQREVVDPYWSKVFDRPITPRIMLQHVGTDLIRNHLHQDMWVNLLKKQILDNSLGQNMVITDVRFQNEIKMVESLGGQVVRVVRGPTPTWEKDLLQNKPKEDIENLPHESEYAWMPFVTQYIDNNDTMEHLHDQLKIFLD
jgi:hypothetical protein